LLSLQQVQRPVRSYLNLQLLVANCLLIRESDEPKLILTYGLPAGTAELAIEYSTGAEKKLTGGFRAVPEEQQGT
jgi:hypothetical protein